MWPNDQVGGGAVKFLAKPLLHPKHPLSLCSPSGKPGEITQPIPTPFSRLLHTSLPHLKKAGLSGLSRSLNVGQQQAGGVFAGILVCHPGNQDREAGTAIVSPTERKCRSHRVVEAGVFDLLSVPWDLLVLRNHLQYSRQQNNTISSLPYHLHLFQSN